MDSLDFAGIRSPCIRTHWFGYAVTAPYSVRPVRHSPAPRGPFSPLPILAKTTPAEPDARWWRVFRDPVLSRLEARLADQNLGTAAAAALPTVNGTNTPYRQQFSQNGVVSLVPSGALGGGLGGAGDVTQSFGRPFENITTGLDASWELDLWGRVGRDIEVAGAQVDASAGERRSTLVSVLAELARDDVQLRGDLIIRRPAIRQADANLHAAVAEIGVAEAEFFPTVTTMGDPTFNALDPNKVFRGNSLQYMMVGPSISIPIFDGGRLRCNLVLTQARQQGAAIAYQQAVLQAWHDVVNALAALKGDEGRRAFLQRQVADARRGLGLARTRDSRAPKSG